MTKQAEPETAAPRTRRDEILRIAAQVIAERGLAGATVRDIGQAAGILSGSLYHHFESKEEIVLDLLLDNVTATHERATAISEAAPDATTALTGMIRNAVEETAARPHESLILRNETRAFVELPKLAPLADIRARSARLWIDVVDRGVAAGEFRADMDTEVAAMALVDSVLGAARWFGSDQRKDVETVASSLLTAHLSGLTAG